MYGFRLSLPVAVCIVVTAGCSSGGDFGRDRLSSDWPRWQLIEVDAPPEAWRVEEASVVFDAWETTAVVTELSIQTGATEISFQDADGNALDVRLAPLRPGRLELSLARGDAVRVQLIHHQGFEGVSRGLAVRNGEGRLLLLYDDGGYGPAFYEDGAREGISVTRSLRGSDTGNAWEPRPVTFELAGEAVTLEEGETSRLGGWGLAVSVVVSREWTGSPPTDVDLTPLAYLIYRVR